MAVKRKTKAVTKKVTAKPKTLKHQKGESHFHFSYLAVAILALVLLEGLLLTCSSKESWKDAASIMDVGPGIVQGAQDIKITLSPVVETVNMVNQFYYHSTDAAMELLDLENPDDSVLDVYHGVNRFYILASIEMENLLGLQDLKLVYR